MFISLQNVLCDFAVKQKSNGSKRGRVTTRTGSRNVARRVGMWVIGYELSRRTVGYAHLGQIADNIRC